MQQQKYLRIWYQINPTNDTFINTSKLIQWILNLLNYQIQKTPQKQKSTIKNIEKTPSKLNKLKNSQNLKQRYHSKNKKISKIQKLPHQKPNKQKLQNSFHQIEQNQEILKTQITEELIFQYIQKYIQTDQYKFLPKPKTIIEIEKPQEQKQKKKHHKVLSQKKNTKKIEPKQIQKTKYDDQLISLTYQESIFFYYWLIKNFENDKKILQQQIIAQLQQQNKLFNQKLQNQQNLVNQFQQQDDPYKPKFLMQLNQRQLIDLNQESFIDLKKYQPKLRLLFKHYAKLSHQFSKKIFTFDEANILQQMMNLHQWMLFCKDWAILNARSISETWVIGKITRQVLMDFFYKNSFYRKQMSFQMFERALVSISSRMYQDCDLNHFKPIQLFMNFLSIKDDYKFLENLKIKKITYSQGDLLSCFKDKNREVFSKVKIVKKLENHSLQRSKSEFMKTERLNPIQNINPEKFNCTSKKQINNFKNEFSHNMSQSKIFNPEKQTQNYQKLKKKFSTDFSKLSQNKELNINRKSAPEIGIHLPMIQNTKSFKKVPFNNNPKKFKQNIKQQFSRSNSVLKNKITGYHQIYDLYCTNDEQKMKTKNIMNEEKMNQLINSKLKCISQRKNFK